MADFMAGFFGARRQGKSTQVHHLLWSLAPDRLLIFDPMNEYGADAKAVPSLEKMRELTLDAATFRYRFVPPKGTREETIKRFDAFCELAYARGNLVMVVEELQIVTRANWAPPAWEECTLRGGHRHLAIVGVSQRPANVDKNFLDNCDSISTARLNTAAGIQTMAGILGRSPAQIAALKKHQFIARDMDSGEVIEGHTDTLLAAMRGERPRLTRRATRKK